MNQPLHQDILNEAPLDPLIRTQLLEGDFSEQYVDGRVRKHQEVIDRQLGRVGLVIEMSQPTVLRPVEAIHGEAELPQGDEEFIDEYLSVRRSPRRKLEYDAELVDDLLLKLGPTNSLRNREGFDAGVDLGRIVHLLATDYERMPDAKKRPEMRQMEGLAREELALLWRPRTPEKLKDDPHQAFMFDLEDPNIFSQAEIDTMPEADRWKRIGMRLSDEAADVFQNIYESPTADLKTRMEAMCRMTDMRIRSTRLLISTPGGPDKKTLYDKIDKLNADFMSKLADVWTGAKHSYDPAFFELFVVGEERNKMIEDGLNNRLIRLALPREDQVHIKVPGIYDRQDVRTSLSTDVVVEDMKGRFIKGYQAKAMTQKIYETKVKPKRAAESGKVHYMDEGRYPIQLRFADDYATEGTASNLNRLLVDRSAA